MSFYNLSKINSPTVPLSVTASNSTVALPAQARFVEVTNLGPSAVWCTTGPSTITATASTGNNVCIAPGAIKSHEVVNNLDTTFAAICASGGTATLSISVTNGQ